MIGILLISFIILIIFKLFKWMNVDTLSFSGTTSIVLIIFMFSGLIPHNISNSWIWIIRIFILILSVGVIFLLVNSIINQIIARTSIAEQAIRDYSDIARDSNLTKKGLTDLTNEYKKHNDMDSLEV
jgi:hypothetical protein